MVLLNFHLIIIKHVTNRISHLAYVLLGMCIFMKSKIAALLLISLGFAHSASAVPYYLETVNATKTSGTTNSDFYQVTGGGAESGTALSLYSFTFGGSASAGWWVEISFGGNPQPILTSAFLKAGPNYLWWDAADLLAFNAATFDSIILKNDNAAAGLRNPPNNAFLGIGHVGLNGTAGELVVEQHNNVPDASSTVAMLGLGMIGLFVAARRRASK